MKRTYLIRGLAALLLLLLVVMAAVSCDDTKTPEPETTESETVDTVTDTDTESESASETETETQPAVDNPTFYEPEVILARFNGIGAPPNFLYWNNDGCVNFGQKFNVGTYPLKQVIIDSVGTYEGYVNTWNFKIWQWDGTYSKTVAGTPLYEYTGYNHPDCEDMVIDIPENLTITGVFYYEITVLETDGSGGANSFMPWIGSAPQEGLESYKGGMLALGNYASRIVVELGDEVETPPETEADTTPAPDVDLDGYDVIVLGEFTGRHTTHNKWGSQPFGQKFVIPEGYALKGLTINSLTTLIEDANTWTLKFWQ